ncbi:hypothetical protein ABZX92_27610 [Lentzea sp. NPDC006480]|uniref:golvesin C-terminal-like domain-containing protein n=1 Tax=Lentzea sp. NPDC006480 TaxID=3157176 RepID=UPI0033BD26BD
MRTRRLGKAAAVVSALALMLSLPVPDAAPAQAAGQVGTGVDLAAVDPGWWRGTDLMVTGQGDSRGYHLYLGREREKYAFRPLASIQPGGYDADEWLGYQCVTGDRSTVAVTLLPRGAVNKPVLRDRGGLSYLVDIATGKTRPVAKGVAFKYHATGCGAGSEVALLRHLGDDQARTELLKVDARTGVTARAGTVAGQLTSAVPTRDGLLALRGNGVVRINGDSEPTVQATVDGEPFRLTSGPDGAVNVLVKKPDVVELQELRGTSLRLLGSGANTRLFAGADGRNTAFGLVRSEAGASRVATRLSGDRVETTSIEGKVALASTRPGAAPQLFATASGVAVKTDLSDDIAPVVTRAVPAGDGGTAEPKAMAAAPTPTCAVPRNDPRRQAFGSSPEQSNWAVEMASRNLIGSAYTRPANHHATGLPAFAPSNDFPVPSLYPHGGFIPPAVMNGVLAQESAYSHASWRTLRGSGGNPLIGDYYGAGGTLDDIDYGKSDCGYGIAQVTTGMRADDTSISANGKAKIATDYAENIQAGLGILADKWNQVVSARMFQTTQSWPERVEMWYLPLWAYNTGINPGPKTGNTTGCTPGPSCTDGSGNWGLGWTNNPMNPDYPPNRDVFLRATYDDARHPSDWPYQERVLGWAETPIQIPWGHSAYPKVTAGPGGDAAKPITYPNRMSFCTTANYCDKQNDGRGSCARPDFHCWWHSSVPTCEDNCARSDFTQGTNAPEPSAANPWAPACDSDLGPRAVIVDELADPNANLFCPQRNWQNAGTFAYTVGEKNGQQVGAIDFHQAATGFGGHTWFAGNQRSGDGPHLVTGTWTPNNLAAGTYVVRAHVPVAGASVSSAVYQVTTANGEVKQRVINQHEHYNHWKSLGIYQLGPNAKVSLSNVTRDDTEPDVGTVAFDGMAFVPVTGRPVEETIDAYAYFDENQNLDTTWPASWVSSPLTDRQSAYQWAADKSNAVIGGRTCPPNQPAPDCVAFRTFTAAQQWHDNVFDAGTDPVNHPRGQSIPQWLGFSNKVGFRPTGTTKPPLFDTDDTAYKIRSRVTITYVVGADGKIVDGSADASYDHRTGDTELPFFVRDFIQAASTDYGLDFPNLNYSTTNLNIYDHHASSADPQYDGILPGRAFRFAGKRPVVTDYANAPVPSGGSCVATLYASGGMIGYRPMLGVGYVSTSFQGWAKRLRAAPNVPSRVADVADEIYNMFFKAGTAGSLFNQAPPIWQELSLRACADGTVTPLGAFQNYPMLRSSYMPDQYLYRNGQAIELDGRPRTSAGPVTRGDFKSFSRIPPRGDTPFADCDTTTDHAGNPWGMSPGTQTAGYEPDGVHFCLDKSIKLDPDHSG